MEDRLTPEGIYKDTEQLSQLGEEYSDYKSAYDYLESVRKSVLAKCFFDSGETTIAAREHDAARNIEYIAHLEALSKAQKKMLKARVRYDTAITRLDMIRSMESTNRKFTYFKRNI